MEQIAEAIWTFGRKLFGDDRHRLDRSVVSMVLSEPSETCEAYKQLWKKM